jgi:hypothetical protein
MIHEVQVVVRMTREEREHLHDKCSQHGESLQTYMRRMIGLKPRSKIRGPLSANQRMVKARSGRKSHTG